MAIKVPRLLKSPRALSVILWIVSIVIGWVFNRIDKADSKKSVNAKRMQ